MAIQGSVLSVAVWVDETWKLCKTHKQVLVFFGAFDTVNYSRDVNVKQNVWLTQFFEGSNVNIDLFVQCVV